MNAVAEYDVLIIGTGVGGLSSAIKLAETGSRIALITRERDPNETNTFWAQGGIIHVKDNVQSLVDDIMHASANTSHKDAALILGETSGSILEELLLKNAQTNFERDDGGELKVTKEAAHSEARILYRGDYTGREIQVSLLNYLKDKTRFPNVDILTAHTAIDLITARHHGTTIFQRYEEDKVLGAYVFDQDNNQVKKMMAKFTVLATGGIGACYLHHSNSEGARGDGIAMANRAGAIMVNMEFIQFHPSTFFDASGHRRFLITEAVRGEGGRLLNITGERFMERYHPDMELAPRDVVARSIHNEMIETQHECVFLDISFKDADWIKSRFPTIYEHCLKKGVDITKEPIPIVPAAHYLCGGVKTDLVGRTSIDNLYAVGEVACTGLHGANRLASTSLLEGLSWGYFAAKDITEHMNEVSRYDASTINEWFLGDGEISEALVYQDWMTLKQSMWNYVGLSRSNNKLKRARAIFGELSYEVSRFYKHAKLHDSLIGLRNGIEVALLVIHSSMQSKHSVGCFHLEN